jgi:ribosome-binding protein aMBF1 (putative translation factor)
MKDEKTPKDISAVDRAIEKTPRGFARLSRKRRQEIASLGGQAAHAKGTAHKFTPEEGRQAGKKGGRSVSANIPHMMRIGKPTGDPSMSSQPVDNAPPKFHLVGEVIKHLRVTAGLSRAELANRTGLAQVTIQSIERGKRPPHRSTIQKLQRASAMQQLVQLCSEAGLLLPSLQ